MSIRGAVLERPFRLPLERAALVRACAAAGVVAGLAFIGALATYHLDLYPTTWFDEGSHLHVPKALLQYGVYADTSSDGFRYFGPTTGVGPTVMLPIAAAFAAFGIGLLQARLVIVAYLLIGLLAFAVLARRQYGPVVAILALGLLISSPGLDVLYFGRQVLGEVPAFAFLMLALLAWWSSADRTQVCMRRLLIAAIGFGLVALTKNQFTLVLAPTLIVAAVVDRAYHRALSWRAYVVPFIGLCAGVAIGLAFQFVPALGSQDLGRTMALYRDASAGAIFVFSPTRIASSLKFLVSADVFGYWGLPAVVYGVALSHERSRRGAQQALLAIFVLLGLGWYALGSIGWSRYAFPALVLTAVMAAKLLVDLFRALPPHSVVRAAPIAMCALLIASPLASEVRTIVAASDRGPQAVAAYLDATVPPSAVVETWEPELGFLSNRAFHYPPSGWLDRAVRAQWLGATALDSTYDPIGLAQPEYLVIGPFGKYTRIYQNLLDRTQARPLATFGAYDVYRLASGAGG